MSTYEVVLEAVIDSIHEQLLERGSDYDGEVITEKIEAMIAQLADVVDEEVEKL